MTEGFDPARGGPGVERPAAHLGWQLRDQARACEALSSPLYARLLRAAAEDVAAGGPVWQVLRGHVGPGRSRALALRLMAAVHRLVLAGRARALAAHYPTAGGRADDPDAAAAAFLAAVDDHAGELADAVARPCQTNEVGRAAPVAGAVLWLAGRWGQPPLRLLEVGCAGGLQLRLDRFAYGDAAHRWGPRDSPVDLVGWWAEPPPWPLPAKLAVVERRGADRHPIDPRTDEGRLALASSVWADQPARLERLQAALRLAAAEPAVVEQADAVDWAQRMLARLPAGVGTVLWHTVLWEYLTASERDGLAEAVHHAGQRASERAPLAWVRLEPATSLRAHALTVTTWPGGRERLLARSRAHGQDVTWHDPAT